MKKLLIATTALVATTGVAVADVTLSGLGRFGLDYHSTRYAGGVEDPDLNKAQVVGRLRFNVDASTTTDAGVTFGGRIRVQWDQGVSGGTSRLSPAMLYASANGFRMEVGNANTAIDSVALMYNSEIGAFNRSLGGPLGTFAAFSTGPFNTTVGESQQNRMGVFGSYSIDGLNIRASIIDPDQTGNDPNADPDAKREASISADYNFGDFTVAAAYASNSGFDADVDEWFLGGQYQVAPGLNVGLLHSAVRVSGGDNGRLTTLYGNYRVDAITYRGYIARANTAAADARASDAGGATTRTVFGLGVDYDLGGARLGADIHRTHNKDTIAGLGVRFDF